MPKLLFEFDSNRRFYRNKGLKANQAAPENGMRVILSESGMSEHIYNFSAGPAMIPAEVIAEAAAELASVRGSGLSVMEISHRSALFGEILEDALDRVRRLLNLPESYEVLFLQGGATLQFSMVPMNLLAPVDTAEYVVTGYWGKKAAKIASRYGEIKTIYSAEDKGFTAVPANGELRVSPNASYLHYTSNETIDGVEFDYDVDAGLIPVVCDMSSNILSRPIDIEKYGLIYAGAQKNLGPSGLVLVVIRKDLLDRSPRELPDLLTYKVLADNNSMANTPNTWAIYMLGLVCKWLEARGGPAGIDKLNEEKARLLYEAIDKSDGFYAGHAERTARSRMNVTFKLPNAELDAMFVKGSEENGMNGLAGHRAVGGIRASIYNAMPISGVKHLVEFMAEFARKNG
ncbi:MAG: phosphoserine aminotransferase [Acidobacteria bacterium OLB17]|nr:MAG: phosphoserine aminotransferase [Acidobacteria bacterium OLB17]